MGACGAALALAACSTMPDKGATPPELPAAWDDLPVAAQEQSLATWWTAFSDPLLEQLVLEAMETGPDVRLAATRIREARALGRQAISAYLPELGVEARGSYSRVEDGPPLFGSFQNFVSGTIVQEQEQMIGTYGPTVSWEIPLFGRIQASAVGSRAGTRAALEDYRGVKAALAADLAGAYVDLRANQQRVAALNEAVSLSDQLAEIVALSARAGLASESEAADARRQAEATRAAAPDAVIAVRQSESQIAVLRGRAPGTEAPAVQTALRTLAPIPVANVPATAPAAPADLLRLRPDIAQAEAQTIRAAAGVGVARADLLPQLRLTGSLDYSDNLIGSALPERQVQLGLTPTLSIPLLDWGRRQAGVRVRNAQFDAALITYEQVVANAVAEANGSLVGLVQGERRLQAARAAEQAAEANVEGLRAAYRAGLSSLRDRLRAEQQLIDARLTRIEAERSMARAAIAVYRAFGGGAPPLAART